MNTRFLMQYIIHPRTTGAILPSSKKLSYKMIKNINFNKCNCIIEFGPGTGVFTEEILKRCNEKTKVILIEYNKEFFNILKNKYNHIENVYIINDSAENIDYYIDKYNITKVDYIVSGLPFASLPKEVTEIILEKTKIILSNGGAFITFQYTKLKMPLIKNYFKNIKVNREFFNIPPAYVFSCTNEM